MRASTALMAALLLLLLVSLAAADIHIPYGERSEEEMRLIFAEWKAEIGRTYSSASEEERHYATFKDNLRDNERKNEFSDLTQEEFGAIPCVVIPSDHDKDMAGWRLMTYMLFGCSFFIIYFTICWLLLPFGSSGRHVGGEDSFCFSVNP